MRQMQSPKMQADGSDHTNGSAGGLGRQADGQQVGVDAHPADGGALVQDHVVVTLRTDSFECPHCGNIVVATDDLVIDLASEHECGRPSCASTGGGG